MGRAAAGARAAGAARGGSERRLLSARRRPSSPLKCCDAGQLRMPQNTYIGFEQLKGCRSLGRPDSEYYGSCRAIHSFWLSRSTRASLKCRKAVSRWSNKALFSLPPSLSPSLPLCLSLSLFLSLSNSTYLPTCLSQKSSQDFGVMRRAYVNDSESDLHYVRVNSRTFDSLNR